MVASRYSEKVSLEKAAIKRSSTECKLQSLLKNEPPKFRVDIHHGPMLQDELSSWARQQMHAPGFVIKEDLYDIYLDSRRRAAKLLMLQECKVSLDNGVAFQEIEQVLSCPAYQVIKADILMELRRQSVL